MNNLVERLHAYVGEDVTTRADRLIKEAADEIERLTAKLKAYDNPRQTHSEKCWARHGHSECAVREIERLSTDNVQVLLNNKRLNRENTKLRAALERIKYDCSKCKRTAREALETE